jgi:hypothetical protein
MFRSAVGIFDEWLEEISAVALTKMTAQQVIDDLKKGQEDEKVESVPNEL